MAGMLHMVQLDSLLDPPLVLSQALEMLVRLSKSSTGVAHWLKTNEESVGWVSRSVGSIHDIVGKLSRHHGFLLCNGGLIHVSLPDRPLLSPPPPSSKGLFHGVVVL